MDSVFTTPRSHSSSVATRETIGIRPRRRSQPFDADVDFSNQIRAVARAAVRVHALCCLISNEAVARADDGSVRHRC